MAPSSSLRGADDVVSQPCQAQKLACGANAWRPLPLDPLFISSFCLHLHLCLHLSLSLSLCVAAFFQTTTLLPPVFTLLSSSALFSWLLPILLPLSGLLSLTIGYTNHTFTHHLEYYHPSSPLPTLSNSLKHYPLSSITREISSIAPCSMFLTNNPSKLGLI